MKAFFLSRILREKILLLAFAALGAAIWFSSVSDRVEGRWREIRRTSADLDVQRRWLMQSERISREASAAIEHLDPSRTFDNVRLQSELNTLASGAHLANYDVSDSRTESTSQFAVHTVQFSARNADIGSLVAFYTELGKRAPYISIEQFSLDSNRSNPALLNASWRVSSVEIQR